MSNINTEEENFEQTNNEELESTDEVVEESSEDEINYKEELEKAKAEAAKYRRLLKKSSKEDSKTEKKKSDNNESSLNHLDTIALVKADVNTDDIKEVIDYAKYKGISIQEALESNIIKSMLNDNAEKRQSAEIAHSGSAKKSSSKLSDEVLIEKANSGELPESSADLTRLINARKGIK